jgi:nitrite reductase/ring-hydroxylating ferredoxin subunit/uncharacterized membrane protein
MAEPIADRVVRSQRWLDPLADVVQKLVAGFFKLLGRPGRLLKSFLHGSVWLGHALHPLLTDVPVGAWTVAVAADVLAALSPAVPHVVGDLAVAVGVVTAYAAVVTGLTDYADTYGQERRVATAHGLLMTLVTLTYTASMLMRWLGGPGAHGPAVVVAVAGYVVMSLGAYLGGHLVLDKGTMVNRNAFVHGPRKWTDIGTPEDYPEGSMKKAKAGSTAVLVVRLGGALQVIGDTCSHAGGPLDEGTLEGDVVTCPWHGSRFCVRDGSVREGPATFSQPQFEARVEAGKVEVRQVAPVSD